MKIIIMLFSILCLATSIYASSCVVVCGPSGIVFASEGRISAHIDDTTSLVLTDTGQKIFKINDYSMAMLMGQSTHNGKEFGNLLMGFINENNIKSRDRVYLDSVTKIFVDYFKNKFSSDSSSNLQIYIGGINYDGSFGCIRYMPYAVKILDTTHFNIFYSGTESIARGIEGIDPFLKKDIRTLFKENIDTNKLDTVLNKYDSLLNEYKCGRVLPEGTIPDMVEFAYIYIRANIILDRLVLSVYKKGQKENNPKVGGEIQIAAITYDGFHWLLPPDLLPTWLQKISDVNK